MAECKYEQPSDKHLVERLKPMIDLFRKDPLIELECRLGVLDGRFKAGVSKEYIQSLLNVVMKSPLFETEEPKTFFYAYYSRGIRAKFEPDTEDFPRIERLERLDHAVVTCNKRLCCFKIGVKRETPVDRLPCEAPHTIRMCKRQSATVKGTPFVYEFTTTVQGKTKEDACSKSASQYEYMIEIEVQHSDYFNLYTSGNIAVELLGKTRDILGRYDAHEKLEDLPLMLQK